MDEATCKQFCTPPTPYYTTRGIDEVVSVDDRNTPYALTTITFSSLIALPATVNISGYVDDVLLFNEGSSLSIANIFPGENANSGAHNINYTKTVNSRTFTVGAKDTKRGGAGLRVTITIGNTSGTYTP